MDYGHWTNAAGNRPEECIGFIYRICNTTNNRKYIGKKLLKFKTIKKPLKGRVNKRRGLCDSDWRTYTGSCNQLNEDIEKIGKDKFTFEILSWCKNKSDLSYEEMKQIIFANALFDKDYYNEYVGGRVRIRKG
jgi:Putative endonuclease segE, GIY-YIG domain